jgi:hypothetical protein
MLAQSIASGSCATLLLGNFLAGRTLVVIVIDATLGGLFHLVD